MLNFILTVVFVAPLLVGCVGSQFVVDDADVDAPYPDLHLVPDRPQLPERPARQGQDLQGLQNALSTSQRQALEENARLREENGL